VLQIRDKSASVCFSSMTAGWGMSDVVA
jgi:hypothetical protein